MNLDVDRVFSAQVQALAAAQASWALAADAGEGRTWFVPDLAVLNGRTPPVVLRGDPLDLGPDTPFDRGELGANMAKVIDKNSPGSVGEAAAVRMQSDYLAAFERAYRTRHLTSVRAEAFAAGRRRGLGAGGTERTVIGHAQNLITAGQGGAS